MTGIRSQDSWVLDTAYSGWLDLVLDRADLIVGLDYPRWRSLGRLVRRTAARIIGRRPVCNGNVETLRNALSRDAIIAWRFRTFGEKRTRMREWRIASSGPSAILFASPRPARR